MGEKHGVRPVETVAMPDENGNALLYSIRTGSGDDDVLWYRAMHVGSMIAVKGDEIAGQPGVMSQELCRGEPGKERLLARLVRAVDEFETAPAVPRPVSR